MKSEWLTCTPWKIYRCAPNPFPPIWAWTVPCSQRADPFGALGCACGLAFPLGLYVFVFPGVTSWEGDSRKTWIASPGSGVQGRIPSRHRDPRLRRGQASGRCAGARLEAGSGQSEPRLCQVPSSCFWSRPSTGSQGRKGKPAMEQSKLGMKV